MSRTEINFFKKTRFAYLMEVQNSWRGAMAVWRYFKQKYNTDVDAGLLSDSEFKETWNLFSSDKLSRAEKIVLGSTFDWVVVRRNEIEELCKAFIDLNIGSLPEQAEKIKEVIDKNKSIKFITWNGTSVCENKWIKYSLYSGKNHWFLFDEL